MSTWKRKRDWGMIAGNGNKGKYWDIGKGNRDLGQGVETGEGMEVWNREERDKGSTQGTGTRNEEWKGNWVWPGNWERYDRQQKLGVRDTDYVVIANTHTHKIVHKCD